MRHRLAGARRQVARRAALATCSTAPACSPRPPRSGSRASTAPTPRASRSTRRRRKDVIVAYQMEGGDISAEHGGPVRLYVAPMYGYKSIKWLDDDRADPTGSSPGTGRTTATTSTDGWDGPMAATTTPPDAGGDCRPRPRSSGSTGSSAPRTG